MNEERFFGFDPLGWIDDVYNANGDIIADSVDAFEEAVAREVLPLAAQGAAGQSMAASRSMSAGRGLHRDRDRGRSCSVASRFGMDTSMSEEESKLMEQVKGGCDKLLHALHAAFDKNFDKFELYCLRNILAVPDQAVSRLVASEMAAAASAPRQGDVVAPPLSVVGGSRAGALSDRGIEAAAPSGTGAGTGIETEPEAGAVRQASGPNAFPTARAGSPGDDERMWGESGACLSLGDHPKCPSVAEELATAASIAELREQVVQERRRRRALMTVKSHYERVLPRCEGVAAKLQRVPELVRTTVSAMEASSMSALEEDGASTSTPKWQGDMGDDDEELGAGYSGPREVEGNAVEVSAGVGMGAGAGFSAAFAY